MLGVFLCYGYLGGALINKLNAYYRVFDET